MDDLTNPKEPDTIPGIVRDTESLKFSMPSEPFAGSLLRTLAASKPGGRFLELGSGTGLSTAWLLDGMDAESHLTTADNDEQLLAVLSRHLEPDRRLTVHCADGDEFLHSLPGKHFDLIFADTWPGKYRLLDETLSLLSPGGFYFIDDMIPQSNWPEGHAEKAVRLIAALEERNDLHLTKISRGSGIILAVKK